MRFKDFLLVENNEKLPLFQWLWENCSKYLVEIGIDRKDDLRDIYEKATLLRGMENPAGNNIEFKTPWNDLVDGLKIGTSSARRPRDTNVELSGIIDDSFEKIFHIRPRATSVFCVGLNGQAMAREYGKIYRIFPIGDFTYLWSSEIEDLTLVIPDFLKTVGVSHRQKFEKFSPEEKTIISSELNSHIVRTYKTNDLRVAMKSKSEIMIQCDSYLAIPYKK